MKTNKIKKLNRMNIEKKKSPEKRIKAIYGRCIVGMVLLIAIALFLPEVIFNIQDKYRMTNTEVEERDSLEISQLQQNYEMDTYTRMHNFISLEKKTVTSIDYQITANSELTDLLGSESIKGWFEQLEVMGYVIPYSFLDILEWKKYIIYGEDYKDGVVLMMWYIDGYLIDNATRLQLLVDSETNTVYYLKVTARDTQTDKVYSADGTTAVATYGEDRNEKLWILAELFMYSFEFYGTYYEADIDNIIEFQEDNRYEEAWYTDLNADDEQLTASFPLPYGELNMVFQFQAAYGKGHNPDISMGIPAIGQLVPEMIQD